MLNRHRGRGQRTLQLRDVEPENSYAEREGDCWKQVQVLCCFVEGWRVLEDGKPAGAQGHHAEPLPGERCVSRVFISGEEGKGWQGDLHDNQVDEVNTRCLVDLLVVIILIHVRWQRTVFEPEVAEGDTVSL